MTTDSPAKPRGFAAMSPERRRAIAAMGGAAVPPDKRAFATNRELAIRAGHNGGSANAKKTRS